ncbi:MAG: translation initiation factor IF-2 [Candidatus Nanohaloarchaea archaeon]
MPRQPILTVLGHVDAGKTELLDSIRESRVTEGEAGGITQMIGATEVPITCIEDLCGNILNQLDTELTLPGILFIDTPGHAAFSSLRKRGGSISDIAILVIDVNQGIQPQTEEAIKILQDSKTPFVIAFNKIDTFHGWRNEETLFTKNLKHQNDRNKESLNQKIYELMGDLHESYEISADRFDRVDNFQKKVAIVPVSAKTGEGIPELLMTVAGLAQNYLQDQLEVHEGEAKANVLEVSEEQGLGTTIDVIHYDGTINKEDTLVYGTRNGAKTTEIRALLKPRPLEEIRLDKQYDRTDKVKPASGIKIAGKNLEGVISGAPVRTVQKENIEEAKQEVEKELESVGFETQRNGIVVKADSLGSLEAVMREIEDEEIPVQKAEVGDISKSDIIEAENEKPEEKAVFGFNVNITDQAREKLDSSDAKVFRNNVIYEIVENYSEWKQQLKHQQKQKALDNTSRPAKIRFMPDHVFNRSKPAVVGAKIVEGVLTPGSQVMTPEGDRIGRVKSIQSDSESLDKAEKGEEVAVSITNATVGRNLEEGDTLLTDLSGEDYRRLQKLEDLTTQHEKKVLQEIVEIKDQQDPHWKLG